MKQKFMEGFEHECEGKYLRGRLRSQCCPGGEEYVKTLRRDSGKTER
jgi:hypothetical protein